MSSFANYCAAAVAVGGLMLMPSVQAQTGTPPARSTTPDATTKSRSPSDAQLDKAATAAKKVASLQDTYEQKLAQAPVNEKKQIVDEADNAMVKAVTDEGLSVDEFKTIMQLAQEDAVVRNKLIERLK
jgi:hypothetical protein